jgi:hypothetical protein
MVGSKITGKPTTVAASLFDRRSLLPVSAAGISRGVFTLNLSLNREMSD